MTNAAFKATKHIVLRLVTEDDAPFITRLRGDATRNRYLSPSVNEVDAQRAWISRYKEREFRGSEYYYVIQSDDGEALGVVRLYDFQGDSFCWGSWIMKSGAPAHAAIESALSVYELAFGPLGFSRTHFEVRKDNEKVIAFHERFGAVQTGENERENLYALSKTAYEHTRERYRRFLTSEGN